MSVLYSMPFITINRRERKTKWDNMRHRMYKIGRPLNGTVVKYMCPRHSV